MKRNSILGGLIWCALLLGTLVDKLAFTWIELLFLFAPLVIVPLGLELTSHTEQGMEPGIVPSWPERIARTIQLPAALLVVVSFFCEPGRGAAILAGGWFVFCAFLAFAGILRLRRGAWKLLDHAIPAFSFLYIPIGAAWLLASRIGREPLHFQEPIVLLTAVHFHYAGFSAPLLARSVGRALDPAKAGGAIGTAFRIVAVGVVLGPGLLAAGFVIHPVCKLLAALVLAASEIGLAALFFLALRKVHGFAARFLIGIAAASVLFSMVLAAIWAIGEYPLQPFVGLGEMARLHGSANAFGFTLCGLLGWILVADPRRGKGSA
jgi:hypothetical protein